MSAPKRPADWLPGVAFLGCIVVTVGVGLASTWATALIVAGTIATVWALVAYVLRETYEND